MPQPLTLPPLAEATLTAVRRRSDLTTDADVRLRDQLILLAHQGRSVAHIAELVFRSRATVARVLKRLRAGGLDAGPSRTAPGSAPTITPAWIAARLRVIELDPHTVGCASATWTTGRRAP